MRVAAPASPRSLVFLVVTIQHSSQAMARAGSLTS
jgi:hypothetical protein